MSIVMRNCRGWYRHSARAVRFCRKSRWRGRRSQACPIVLSAHRTAHQSSLRRRRHRAGRCRCPVVRPADQRAFSTRRPDRKTPVQRPHLPGLGNAPGDGFVVGQPHDQPAFACHQIICHAVFLAQLSFVDGLGHCVQASRLLHYAVVHCTKPSTCAI